MSLENKMQETTEIESVLTACGWGDDDGDSAHLIMWLNNGHLSILVSQPIGKPRMRVSEMAHLLRRTFSIICTHPKDARDEGAMPVGYFDEMVEGCQSLFPRYRATPYSRYGYLCAAMRTGNLSVMEAGRADIEAEKNDQYCEVCITENGKLYGNEWWHPRPVLLNPNAAKKKWGATLIDEADRFFQAKKRVNGAWVLPPSKRVNGVLIEMTIPCAK
jgi:hypothetical protein